MRKNPTGIEALQMINNKFKEVGTLADNHNKRPFSFLYAGCTLFITRQILEMGLRTFC
jgi:hypothetical protein